MKCQNKDCDLKWIKLNISHLLNRFFMCTLYLMCLFTVVLMCGCDDQSSSESGPAFTSFNLINVERIFPSQADRLESVRIEGVGFGIEGHNDGVWVSGVRMPIVYWTRTQIDFTIPEDMRHGSYVGVVRANDRVSEPFEIEILH